MIPSGDVLAEYLFFKDRAYEALSRFDVIVGYFHLVDAVLTHNFNVMLEQQFLVLFKPADVRLPRSSALSTEQSCCRASLFAGASR